MCDTIVSGTARKVYCSVKCRNRNNYLNHGDELRKSVADYQARNREEVLEKKRRQWRELRANDSRYREYLEKRSTNGRRNRLGAKYGMTEKQYDDMSSAQENVCAMCSMPQRAHGTITRLVVDHDHTTGTVRALLCDSCNLLLGFAGDDVALLEKAIDYLNKHRSAESQPSSGGCSGISIPEQA